MSYMLSLSASSPLREPHSNHSFYSHYNLGRTYSSAGSGRSATGTVQHHRLRSLSSGSSLSSLTSLVAPAFRRHDDQSTASRSSSSHNLTLRRFPTGSDRRSASSSGFSRRASFASVLSSRRRSDLIVTNDHEDARLLGVAETDDEVVENGGDDLSFVEEEEHPSSVIHNSSLAPTADTLQEPLPDAAEDVLPESPKKSGPLRWLSTLRKRKQPNAMHTKPTEQRFALDDFEQRPSSPTKATPGRHKKSESWSSSLRLVTAVRSATATIASMSIATVSRRNTKWRREQQRSSVMSGSDPRPSVESQRSIIDEAAKQRSRKRRDKLEELIRTEESYVADIKALSNVRSSSFVPQYDANARRRTSRCWVISRRPLALLDLLLNRTLRTCCTFMTICWVSSIASCPSPNTTNELRNLILTHP